ncbi:fibritin neck whiskers [Morganella phage vB_MmoM_MP1]|uniref:Fibritin neck whiskers n=1 Tax=Morganella phage vB_MmoM_MP1 TaxID=1852628 RepID=A0A192YAF6_9CAUD|nr:fibritin neck whiskers [Morganella phage vB_MmoM_MP1]ANM46522.1 fibritin neck whiskers [Morganella phage vB_MmoM_MP1]
MSSEKWVPIGTSVGVFTTPTWEGELKDEVNIPVDQALFNERCELIGGGININEGGVYEITLSVNFLNNYKTRDVTLIAKVNDETVIETSANIELMEAKTVYGSVIKRFDHNSVLKLFIKDNEHNESLIQLSNVDIKIKPII